MVFTMGVSLDKLLFMHHSMRLPQGINPLADWGVNLTRVSVLRQR